LLSTKVRNSIEIELIKAFLLNKQSPEVPSFPFPLPYLISPSQQNSTMVLTNTFRHFTPGALPPVIIPGRRVKENVSFEQNLRRKVWGQAKTADHFRTTCVCPSPAELRRKFDFALGRSPKVICSAGMK
jgi:hypothetical protein